jgi:hypothetical protein
MVLFNIFSFEEPDCSLPLVKCEQAMRHEAKRISDIKVRIVGIFMLIESGFCLV